MTRSGLVILMIVVAAAFIVALVLATRKIAAIRRRAQAKAISATVDGLPLWGEEHAQEVHHEYTDRISLVVKNRHAKPIHDFHIELSPHMGKRILDEQSHTFLLGGPDAIMGGETATYSNPYLSRGLATTDHEWRFRFRFYFHDAAGLKWMLTDTELRGPLEDAERPRVVKKE